MTHVGFYWWEQLQAHLRHYQLAREGCTTRADTSQAKQLRYLVAQPIVPANDLFHQGATITVAGHSDVTWTMIATPLRYDLHGPSP